MDRQRLPEERRGLTRKFIILRPDHKDGDLRVYVTVGCYPDGRPGEMFIKADKVGSMASGALDAAAMTTSMALQHGASIHDLASKFKGMRFEPQGFTGDPKFPMVASILDYIGRWLLATFCPEPVPTPSPAPAAPAPTVPAAPPAVAESPGKQAQPTKPKKYK